MELPNLQKVQDLLDSGRKREALALANKILAALDSQRLKDRSCEDPGKSSESAKLYVETSQKLEKMGVWS